MRVFFAVLLALLVVTSASSANLSEYQQTLLQKAHEIGEPYDLSKAMMGVLVQETRAGLLGPVGDMPNGFGERSYGVMQIKLDTAQHIMQQCPELDRGHKSEEQVIVDLIEDDIWNMHLAACYLQHLRVGRTWRQMLLAYNQGPTGSMAYDADQHHYVLSVVNHVTEGGTVHEFIQENDL